jgi:glutathione S-transferase
MNLKLVYFNGRGYAETSRLLLAINNVDYEDFRYPLKIIDWKTHNMVKEEFDTDKQTNKLLPSLNKVPYLEVDGVIIPQSKAIERYLSKTYNMMGDTDLESARVDGICECVRDFKDAYQTSKKLPEDEKDAGLKKWFSETLVEKLELLENILSKEKEGYSVGVKTSLADVVLFSFITQFFDDKESALNALTTTPKLKAIVDNVNNLESVKKWLSTRPDTPF